MSHAIEALLLIRLEARQGEWVSVEDLAQHYSLKPSYVAGVLNGLSLRSLVHTARDQAGGPVMRAMAKEKAEA